MSARYHINLQDFILKGVDASGYDDEIDENSTNSEKVAFIRKTFEAEYGWQINRIGRVKALAEWLAGLPSCVNIPFTYADIIELHEQCGLPVSSDAEIDYAVENHFKLVAQEIFVMAYGSVK